MNAASLHRSGRLQRVKAFLESRRERGATTREIIAEANVCAVNSVVSELRSNGVQIDCKNEGLNDQGAAIFRYKIIPQGQRELLF